MASNLSGNPDHVRHYMSGNPDSVRHYLSGNPDHVRHYVSGNPGSARYYASGNPDGTSKTIHCARAVIPLRSPTLTDLSGRSATCSHTSATARHGSPLSHVMPHAVERTGSYMVKVKKSC